MGKNIVSKKCILFRYQFYFLICIKIKMSFEREERILNEEAHDEILDLFKEAEKNNKFIIHFGI